MRVVRNARGAQCAWCARCGLDAIRCPLGVTDRAEAQGVSEPARPVKTQRERTMGAHARPMASCSWARRARGRAGGSADRRNRSNRGLSGGRAALRTESPSKKAELGADPGAAGAAIGGSAECARCAGDAVGVFCEACCSRRLEQRGPQARWTEDHCRHESTLDEVRESVKGERPDRPRRGTARPFRAQPRHQGPLVRAHAALAFQPPHTPASAHAG